MLPFDLRRGIVLGADQGALLSPTPPGQVRADGVIFEYPMDRPRPAIPAHESENRHLSRRVT